MVDQTSRRKALKLFGGAASTAFIAGCTSPNADDNESDGGSGDNSSDGNSGTESGDGNSSNESGDGNSSNESGDGNSSDGSGDSVDPAQWEDVETIRFQSSGTTWTGAEPEMIADQENPTIVLHEGNEYEFIYENADAGYHNLELWDEDGNIVNEYSTEIVGEMGAERTLTVEATSEIATYVCNPHSSSMKGEVRIE